MTSTPLACSEDRVVLARRGALSSAEWQDFATHLASCADCRIAWRLAVDFDHSAAARAGDEHLVARAVRAALVPSTRRRPYLLRFALAASLVLLAGAASAAIVLRVRRSAPVAPAPAADTAKPGRPRRAVPVRALPPVASPAEEPAPTVAAPTTVVPAPPQGGRAVAAPAPQPEPPVAIDPFEGLPAPLSLPPPAPSPENAATLFARALAERQAGRAPAAIATFRELQREFADSSEATVALVSLGDLLLESRLPAEALAYFQAYLRRAPSGTLAPEAWIGKARALDALGRPSEAQAAWNEIARRFPDARYRYH
jgi:TolA-binding protein